MYKKHIILLFSLLLFISCNVDKDQDFKNQIQNDLKNIKGNTALVLFDLNQNKTLLNINSKAEFHAASTMKVPVMIEVFKQAREGKFSIKDSILVKNEFKSIVDGSAYQMDITDDGGDELYKMVDKKVTIEKLVYDMITVSSNLATNILIDMVDAKKVTETMRSLGADKIEVLRGVEDQKAYDKGLSNSTTANDLVQIFKGIASNAAGSESECNNMLSILKDQKYNDLIPKYYPKNVTVAHKTGSITGVHHDAGIIYLPNGNSYVLVILSKNLEDFDRGTDALAKISKKILDQLTKQ
ncbi:MAG: serine hydrolase [Bacteroidetes bacterium MedPE-SWsnd-G1]|nr:MAG: serine hydrolase [Bacteroidetes bacterium MedPE-SWsnd-G1]